MNLYLVTIACYTRESIVVRADSSREAMTIARDVFLEKPGYEAVREDSLEINRLMEPAGNGYCYAAEPTIHHKEVFHG